MSPEVTRHVPEIARHVAEITWQVAEITWQVAGVGGQADERTWEAERAPELLVTCSRRLPFDLSGAKVRVPR